MQTITAGRFVLAVDGFYPNPDRIRERALRLPFSEPEDYTGWRTAPFFAAGVRERVERILRARVTRWDETDEEENFHLGHGVFYLGLARGPRAETVGIHYDLPADWITMIVYLTPAAPPDAGTSLWRHKATGLAAAPTRADARRLGASVAALIERLEADGLRPNRWAEIDRIGNVYNRAVLYRSGLWHSATRHFGSSAADGRLYQTFRFKVRRA